MKEQSNVQFSAEVELCTYLLFWDYFGHILSLSRPSPNKPFNDSPIDDCRELHSIISVTAFRY